MKNGFTLIETSVAIVIFTLLMGAVFGFIVLGYRTQSYVFQEAIAVQEARHAIDRMTREIREGTTGGDGSYVLERVDDYEIVFYSDIDQDDQTERIRYFINPAGGPTGQLTDTCVSFTSGGSCSVLFNNFLIGAVGLNFANIEVSVEGDLNGSSETADVDVDTVNVGTLCTVGECTIQCSGAYEDPTTYDVMTEASDDSVQVVIDSSSDVGNFCDWLDPNHSVKAQVVFSWEEAAAPLTQTIFRKGVTQPVGFPITYPVDRLNDTTRVHFELIVNVDPNRGPHNFILESDVQLRNLKENL